MFLGIFILMLGVKVTIYSQQPFLDIFVPWHFIILVDLIPIEGFNVVNETWIDTDFRKTLSVGTNMVIMFVSFWLAASVRNQRKRRIVQTTTFAFFFLWYLYLAIVSMLTY